MPIYYKVVKGSVGDISRFETDVATLLASGFIPVGGVAINGTDLYQSLARNTEVDPNMMPTSRRDGVDAHQMMSGPPNPSRQQRPGAMMQSAPSTTPR
jgi:hypothetical protein